MKPLKLDWTQGTPSKEQKMMGVMEVHRAPNCEVIVFAPNYTGAQLVSYRVIVPDVRRPNDPRVLAFGTEENVDEAKHAAEGNRKANDAIIDVLEKR